MKGACGTCASPVSSIPSEEDVDAENDDLDDNDDLIDLSSASCTALSAAAFEIGEASRVSVNGHGKCILANDPLIKKCGGKGATVTKISECNGESAGVALTDEIKEPPPTLDGGMSACMCVVEAVTIGCNV